MCVTFLVAGALLVGSSVVFNMPGELTVGFFMLVLSLVAGVNGLRKPAQ
jgi:hypothetical protein